jgi:hypothetical protein
MYQILTKKFRVIYLFVVICIISCLSCRDNSKERIIYRNLYYEYNDSLQQYGIDTSSMFKNGNKLSKIDYDSLQIVISEVYNTTKLLIEEKTIDGNIDNLYLKIKKDSVWLVYASFIEHPDFVRFGNDIGFQVSKDGKILSIIIGE